MIDKEINSKKNIFIYFQKINFEKEIHEILNAKKSLKKTKNYLKSLFKGFDQNVCNKIDESESFSAIFNSLPKDNNQTKKVCKLLSFEKKSKEKNYIESGSSVRAISIPMGGKNR